MSRISDDELLDFKSQRSKTDRRRLLGEHGDVYRVQLIAARMLDGYRERRLASNETMPVGHSEEFMEGWDEAMRDVIASLRKGSFLPGSGWFKSDSKET